ncbi:MAG: UPF0182 family protein [Bifidobacteriaceae bacterium]|jgi:uncharacterized membrane protein (UPF0182 family)|nr:UPF0182 family protein [Bifidobacteriaceae bacterium]
MADRNDNINEILNSFLGANKSGNSASQFVSKLNNRTPRPKKPLSKGGKLLAWAISILTVLAVIFILCSSFYTDILWYSQVGFLQVLFTQIGLAGGSFLVAFIFASVIVYISAEFSYSMKPDVQITNPASKSIRAVIEKYRRRIFLVVSVFIGLICGISVIPHWSELLLGLNSTPFGKTDPQFGLDISFYVFQLPALQVVVSLLSKIGFFTLAVVAIIQLIYGGFNFANKTITLTRGAKITLTVWIMIFAVLNIIQVIFSSFSILTQSNSRATGADYTSIHAILPSYYIGIAAIAIVAASLTILVVRGKIKVPLIVSAASIIAAVLAFTAYPAVVNSFMVNPNAQELENQYIQRSIEATKDAYGLNNVDIQQYNATTTAKPEALKKDAETAAQIRLLDPQVVAPTFRQLQQNKQYYNFVDTLAVDKYTLNDTSRDTLIAAREINLAGNDQRNWVNDHTVYTHGYGVVAAYGNKVTQDGNPLFYEKDLPPSGDLSSVERYEPRIYFSPNSPDFSIVGAPKGTVAWEFDYPSEKSGTPQTTTYEGNGGPELTNIFTKLAYTIRFASYQMLFSDRVNQSSQVLYYRDPSQRVKMVAPYLTLDGRVYPAVVDGRVKWILDGYTTSANYPYSQTTDLSSITQDSITETSHSITGLNGGAANYVSNSVKATVDAYDGSVNLYAWNPDDPILKSWEKIFPATVKPISDISGDLMSHIRYPENLFKIQRSLLTKYHTPDASQFFSGEDFWHVPDDPTMQNTAESDAPQPPYYLTLSMPGEKEPIFSLTSTFIPGGNSSREILTGFLSADSDAGNKKGVVGPNYGKLHLLELPKNTTVPGPGQAQNNFNSNPTISQALNLLQSGSSKITRGNLLTLPLGGGLIYVQPVYVQSSGPTSFPLLRKILVTFGDSVGFADTLDEALSQVFKTSGTVNSSSTEPAANADQNQTNKNDNSTGLDEINKLKAQLEKAQSLFNQANDALKAGDFAKYGTLQQELSQLLSSIE